MEFDKVVCAEIRATKPHVVYIDVHACTVLPDGEQVDIVTYHLTSRTSRNAACVCVDSFSHILQLPVLLFVEDSYFGLDLSVSFMRYRPIAWPSITILLRK